ncbi:hypothetical protein [Pelagibacterium montanilacus]|uniref:hypothetical protein n=1 Tax=Pelagibacterium montanilacus TaxID=2185280 RepID=UPI000F8F0AAD|nr:hypothetical protein [Pelagibacterium montanilacus]
MAINPDASSPQPSAFVQNPTVGDENPTVGAQPSGSKFVADGRMHDWADPDALARKRDPMLLRRAIEIVPGLTRKRRAAGLAIVDRYNRKTGRCDAAAETFAGDAGINRDTVFAALRVLNSLGLVGRVTYGGNHHANAYFFGWAEAAHIVKTGQPSGTGFKQPSETDTNPVSIYNLSATGDAAGRARPAPSVPQAWRKRAGRGPDRLAGQRELSILGVAHGAGPVAPAVPLAGGVALKKARERVHRDWNGQHNGLGQTPGIRPPAELWERAVLAERDRPGSGILLLNQALEPKAREERGAIEVSPQLANLLRRTGTGPP